MTINPGQNIATSIERLEDILSEYPKRGCDPNSAAIMCHDLVPLVQEVLGFYREQEQ